MGSQKLDDPYYTYAKLISPLRDNIEVSGQSYFYLENSNKTLKFLGEELSLISIGKALQMKGLLSKRIKFSAVSLGPNMLSTQNEILKNTL